MIDHILAGFKAEAERADRLHGPFPTIEHAASVLRREEQEAWAEVWNKPVNRTALLMEWTHVGAVAARAIRLLLEDKSIPAPGPFASRGDDMRSASIPEVK